MMVKGWKSGKHNNSYTSYGIKITILDRNNHFIVSGRRQQNITVRLPNGRNVFFNPVKASFWNDCPELVNKHIKQWMQSAGHIPWKPRKPPSLSLIPVPNKIGVFDLF